MKSHRHTALFMFGAMRRSFAVAVTVFNKEKLQSTSPWRRFYCSLFQWFIIRILIVVVVLPFHHVNMIQHLCQERVNQALLYTHGAVLSPNLWVAAQCLSLTVTLTTRWRQRSDAEAAVRDAVRAQTWLISISRNEDGVCDCGHHQVWRAGGSHLVSRGYTGETTQPL